MNRALDVAERAAANGLSDLSCRAVERALAWGPPTVSEVQDAYEIRIQGARADTSTPLPLTAAEKIRRRIPALLFRLIEVWRKDTDPQRVYQTLRSVVLPPHSNGAAFFYRDPLVVDPLKPWHVRPTRSVLAQLIDHAESAGTLDQLRDAVKAASARDSPERLLLRILVGARLGDQKFVDDALAEFESTFARAGSRELTESTALAGILLLKREQLPDVAARLLSAAAKNIIQLDRYTPVDGSPARAILLMASRAHFAAQDKVAAVDLLEQLLTLNLEDSASPDTASDNRADIVARQLYRRGLVKEARLLLGSRIARQFEQNYRPGVLPDTLAVLTNSGQPDSRQLASQRVIDGAAADPQQHRDSVWLVSHDIESGQSSILYVFPDFQDVRTPRVSPDGRSIAFSATKPGEVLTSDSRIYILRMEDKALLDICSGTMPCWSPQGKRLICSRYSPEPGVWLMRADGSGRHCIHPSGWSAHWSPDGHQIAYVRARDSHNDIVLYDIAEDEHRLIVDGTSAGVAAVFGTLTWSHAGTRIAFRAGRRNSAAQSSLLIASVAKGRDVSAIYQSDRFFGDAVAWSPDEQFVIFSPRTAKVSYETLHQIPVSDSASRDRHTDPERIDGQFPGRINRHPAWQPGGTSILYVSKPVKR